MNRNLIIGGVVAVLLILIPLTVYLAQQQQETRSSAQVETPTSDILSIPTPTTPASSTTTPGSQTQQTGGNSCQVPTEVQNVRIDYPNCQ